MNAWERGTARGGGAADNQPNGDSPTFFPFFNAMALTLDSSTITHGIQLAVAPVFLLTAVSGMIGAVAGRLARIIDRARTLLRELADD